MRRTIAVGLVSMMIAAACGDDPADTTAPSTTAATTTTTAPIARTIEVVASTGAVDPTHGTLAADDSLHTGADGIAVIETDDGTTIVVMDNTTITISQLAWSGDDTLTRVSLQSGTVVAVRQTRLSPGAVFEVVAPAFTAGLTGSAVEATYGDSASGASCLFGDCYVEAADDRTLLTGNESIGLADGVATTAAFTAEQRRIWARALEAIRAAGGGFDACACDERSLLCEGAIEVPYFPSCPDDTNCVCDGPDLTCEDGRNFPNDQQCMAEVPSLAELIVPEFTATYDCIAAHARYKVFDLRPDATVRLRPYDDEASSCANILPWYPITYAIPGPGADGWLAGSASYASGFDSDFVIVESPGEGQQGAFGPRYGGTFTVYGQSYDSTGDNSTISGETTDAEMTKTGTATITILGQTVRTVVYEGTYTGWDRWESNDGRIVSTLQFAGTITAWFDAVTGLELRSRTEGFYTDCSNCEGFPGLRQSLEIVELVSTNQPLGSGS